MILRLLVCIAIIYTPKSDLQTQSKYNTSGAIRIDISAAGFLLVRYMYTQIMLADDTETDKSLWASLVKKLDCLSF